MSIVVWGLWERHHRRETDLHTFKRLSALATGLEIAKIGTIGLLLSIPDVGQVSGALLVAKLLLGAKATWYALKRKE